MIRISEEKDIHSRKKLKTFINKTYIIRKYNYIKTYKTPNSRKKLAKKRILDLHNRINNNKIHYSDSSKNAKFTDFYEKNKVILEQLSNLINEAEKQKISREELLSLIENKEEHKGIPISIFRSNLSPFEAIVYFLKQEGYSLKEISLMLNRSNKTIWTSNSKAEKKNPKLEIDSELFIPINILSDRTLSTLENICVYMHDTLGLKFKQCAELLDKNKNTIWTTYKRGKDKQ